MCYYWLTCKTQSSKSNFTQSNSTIPCPEALKRQDCTAYTHCCEIQTHRAAEAYKNANHRCIQIQPSHREHQLSQAAKSLQGLGTGELVNTPWLLLPHQSQAIWPGCILGQVFSLFQLS